jgi:post-segregation antitoxin (ccd killing protein)
MQFAAKVRKQLFDLCRKEDIPVQSAGSQTDLVRRAMVQGLFTNVARLTKEGIYVTVKKKCAITWKLINLGSLSSWTLSSK